MLAVRREEDRFDLTVPAAFFDRAALAAHVRAWRAPGVEVRLAEQGGHWHLAFTAREGPAAPAVRAFFAGLNGYPVFPAVRTGAFRPAEDPGLSCIILLTANTVFVAEVLIPGLLAHTPPGLLEVIVVYNGTGADLAPFAPFRVVTSAFGSVSRGYNAGVRAARGAYVALFHDDCVVTDGAWFATCRDLLRAGHAAVTPELLRDGDLLVAKNVPLVMRRADFEAVGGYDDAYHLGIEDIDFTYRLLASGRRVGRAAMGYRHFRGMSTIIMHGQDPALYQELFGHHVLPEPVIRALLARRLAAIRRDPVWRAMLDRDYLYFIDKFEPFLAAGGHERLLREKHVIAQRAALRGLFAPDVAATLSDPGRLAAYHRVVAGARAE